MKKRLTRSSTNRLIAGVCGGLGEYLGIDPTWIRLLFIFLTPFSYFASIIVYIACVFLIPENRNIQKTDFRENLNHTLHKLNDHQRTNQKKSHGSKNEDRK